MEYAACVGSGRPWTTGTTASKPSAEINFPNPGSFDAKFRKNYPNDWSAVSWEYPAIMLNWLEGAKAAGSIESTDVLNALTNNPNPEFVFGEGKWWGKDLWGRDNIVIGRWPVVVVEDGKARIQEYGSVTDWLDKHTDVLIKYMKSHDLRTVA